jgi:glycosyltransferase involved in cell wall biosynthesis
MRNRRPWLKRISFPLVEKRILVHAAVVQYTSMQEQYEAEALGVPTRGVVIPNAVEQAPANTEALVGCFHARYPQWSGRILVMFLSRLDHKKGLDILLPAFADAHRSELRLALVIAGAGSSEIESQIRHDAVRLGIERDVVWTGFIQGEEKWTLLAAADIFALPSYSENFAVSVVEAMSTGVPVIISDRVGIHHEITARTAGLVTPCNRKALAHALLTLARDGEARRQMGMHGRQLARERFSPTAVSRQLVALYDDIAAAGRVRVPT